MTFLFLFPKQKDKKKRFEFQTAFLMSCISLIQQIL